ncbi:MAG: alpha/beta fold hydrolase [Myxococcota bacterium]
MAVSSTDLARPGHGLPPAVPGAMHELSADGVRFVLYERAGDERDPVLLVHSVNAAASAYEVRPIFERLRERKVYALDLPGFGRSERPKRRYTPALMTEALRIATEHVSARHGGAPIDALAVSLSCEFLARAADEYGGYRTLGFVAATGLEGRNGPRGTTRAQPVVRSIVACSWWSAGLFRGLTRPRVIRFFLRKTWGRRGIDEGLQAYCEQSTRVPGAKHAPLSFLSGELFSADASLLYEALEVPVWSAYGVRGDFAHYGASTHLESGPNWTMQRFDSGALPHFEMPREFLTAYAQFLSANAPSESS